MPPYTTLIFLPCTSLHPCLLPQPCGARDGRVAKSRNAPGAGKWPPRGRVLRSAGRSCDRPSSLRLSVSPSPSQAPRPPQLLLCPIRMKPQLHSGTGLDPRCRGAELPRPPGPRRHVPRPSYRRSAQSVPAPRLLVTFSSGSQGQGWAEGLAAGLLAQQTPSRPGSSGRNEAQQGHAYCCHLPYG